MVNIFLCKHVCWTDQVMLTYGCICSQFQTCQYLNNYRCWHIKTQFTNLYIQKVQSVSFISFLFGSILLDQFINAANSCPQWPARLRQTVYASTSHSPVSVKLSTPARPRVRSVWSRLRQHVPQPRQCEAVYASTPHSPVSVKPSTPARPTAPSVWSRPSASPLPDPAPPRTPGHGHDSCSRQQSMPTM